jgi:hypothetical protein
MRKATVLPFVARPAAESPMAHAEVIEEVSIDEELPAEPDAMEDRGLQTMRIDMRAPRESATSMPFLAAPDTQEVSVPVPTAPMAPVYVAPPALVAAPISMDPIAAPRDLSRWAGVDARQGGGPTVGAAVVSAKLATEAASTPNAAGGGLLAASDAAAGAPERRLDDGGIKERATAAEHRPKDPRDVVKLLWFDPACITRVRKELKWKRILTELDLEPPEDGDEDEETAEAPRDRRHVLEILARGDAVDARGLRESLAGAVGKHGKVESPLVVVSGELQFPFDELETLRATVTAVSPLVAGDKRLKEVVDTVNELLQTPWLQGPGCGRVAEGLTDKVKEAFAQGKRLLGPDYLESHTDRILLERRCYQKRTLFGETWIRSLLAPKGSAEAVPAYLPEKLGKELPMFLKLKARLLVEVDMQQDQYEVHPVALKVVAVGRLLTLAGRG